MSVVYLQWAGSLEPTRRRAAQRCGNTAQVDDDSLDAVPFSFDFGLETLHLVAIEGVRDILPAD